MGRSETPAKPTHAEHLSYQCSETGTQNQLRLKGRIYTHGVKCYPSRVDQAIRTNYMQAIQKRTPEELAVILLLLGWARVGGRVELLVCGGAFSSLLCLFITTVEDGFCVRFLGQ
jgi:hypothetical protein